MQEENFHNRRFLHSPFSTHFTLIIVDLFRREGSGEAGKSVIANAFSTLVHVPSTGYPQSNGSDRQ